MTREHATEDPIRLTLRVPASVEHAYAVFTEEFATWYPREACCKACRKCRSGENGGIAESL